MRRSISISPICVTAVLISIACVLTLTGVVSAYGSIEIKRYFVLRVLFRLFYLNEEANIPAWFSSMVWLLAALLALLTGVHRRLDAKPDATHWIVLGLVFTFLSIDEAAAIHEAIGVFVEHWYPTTGYLAYGWVLVGIPFVITFAIANVRFLTRLPIRVRNLLVLAGAVYVFGALGVEMFSAAHEKQLSPFGYQLSVAVEELCEMVGVILLIHALLGHLQSLGESLVIEIGAVRSETPEREQPDLPAARATTVRKSSTVAMIAAAILLSGIAIVAMLLFLRSSELPATPDAERTDRSGSAPTDRTIIGELGPGDRRIARDGSYVDVHEIELPGNMVVTVVMESTDFDPYLAVLGPDGTRVARDASPSSHISRVELATSGGGSYRVLANAYRPDGVGRYRLQVTIRDPSRPPTAH